MAKTTGTADQIFQRYFLPLYPPEDRSRLGEVRRSDRNAAANPRIFEQLEAIAAAFARLAPKLLQKPDLQLDYSDASVHRLAACLTKEVRDQLTEAVSAAGEVPPLVNLVTHGAVYVAACIVKNHGGTWQVRNPLWESLVRLESRAGIGDLAVFQWWLKSLSDDEVGQPRLADRYRLHVEVPMATPEQLPVIAPMDRKLPRLKSVRYDTLHKYIKAHIPELRDVGSHFPSPERFAELAFSWLDFKLLGGGRMLLMHGPTDRGIHLFWLDLSGFSCANFYPADAFPEHIVKTVGDKLQVHVPILGQHQCHEMLWWGSSTPGST